jgi:hypothetical protein
MQVRRTWATKIIEMAWGKEVRARVVLRRQLGRSPFNKEIDDALKSDNKFLNVTVDEITNAYNTGHVVSNSRCIFASQRLIFSDSTSECGV